MTRALGRKNPTPVHGGNLHLRTFRRPQAHALAPRQQSQAALVCQAQQEGFDTRTVVAKCILLEYLGVIQLWTRVVMVGTETSSTSHYGRSLGSVREISQYLKLDYEE